MTYPRAYIAQDWAEPEWDGEGDPPEPFDGTGPLPRFGPAWGYIDDGERAVEDALARAIKLREDAEATYRRDATRAKRAEAQALARVRHPGVVAVPGTAAGAVTGRGQKRFRWNAVIQRFDVVGAARFDPLEHPRIHALQAALERETPRMLGYSIHVSCGFDAIEAILNHYVGQDGQSLWMYGNVYDPTDGQTPLNWWLDLLKPE